MMELAILSFWLLSAIVHVAIGVALCLDAQKIESKKQPPQIGSWLWLLAGFMGGVVSLGIYWLMYHSTLRR